MPVHFSDSSLRFLRGLKRNNDRDWFNERKSVYEEDLKTPMLALITEINEHLLRFAPDHVRPPGKAMLRIYRDIRFSPDKRPYKTHISAWWARTGMEKTSGAGYYLQLSPTELMIAAGVYMPDREQLLAIRRHLVTHHQRLRDQLTSRRLKTLGFTEINEQPLTRPPKGFAGETEALDLLVRREWGMAASLPATTALSAGLVHEVVRRFERCAAMVDLLNEPLVPRAKKPLFGALAF